MQKDCRLWPAKPPAELKKVYKRLQKKNKIVFISVKKKINVKEVFINDLKAKDSGKE